MNTKLKKIFKSKGFIIGLASFFVPALILYIVYAINGVHPFGDKQIIVTDLWHQYYPFLCEFQEKLKTGDSLLYSDGIGMGINFLALTSYYCASALNLLTVFFSKDSLRDVMTIFVTMKIGFAGLFCSLYLRRVFKREDFSTIAFSTMFALCGYVLGYYWNIMWLDSVAMLPLVALGVHKLIDENKFILYTVSLALAVIFNFYIGYMICIFTAIYFFAECIVRGMDFKTFAKKLGLIALFSLIALAISAFITIPTYKALGNSYSASKGFTSKVKFNHSFIDVWGRNASFNEPSAKEGLPNLFSGFISVVLLGMMLSAKKIKLREKIVSVCILALMIFSINVNIINFVWHGFHSTNMVPYRYAFIFSFFMVIIAYRAFTALEKEKCAVPQVVTMGIIALFTALCALEKAKIATVLGCAALGIVYIVLLHSYSNEKKPKAKGVFCNTVCGIIIAEMFGNVLIAVPTVRVTTYSTYYYKGDEIESVLQQSKAEDSYGRVEDSQEYILNDPALYGYNGISTFTSTANYPITEMLRKLALCAPTAANRYYYETTSPLTNAFLGIERIFFRSMANLNPYLEREAEADSVVIYKNSQSLPLGFMTENAILDADFDNANPFEVQNDLFRRATGLTGDIFTPVELATVNQTNMTVLGSVNGIYTYKINDESDPSRDLVMNYVVPDKNSIYAYIDSPAADSIKVSDVTYKAAKRKYIFPAGSYEPGEKVSFTFNINNTELQKNKKVTFYVYSLNEALFEDGMDLLRDEPLEITKKESTLIEGNITANEDGLFYFSMPYEKGWKLYVDGVRTEITPIENALIAAPLSKGEHTIKLTYKPDGFVLGCVISLLALLALTAAAIISKKKAGTEVK